MIVSSSGGGLTKLLPLVQSVLHIFQPQIINKYTGTVVPLYS